MKYNAPRKHSLAETFDFLNKNTDKLPNGQYRLRAPLFVFKKVVIESTRSYTSWPYSKTTRSPAIANLVIPTGTVINMSPNTYDCKLRAEQAYCHSIVRVSNGQHTTTVVSDHDSNFTYRSGVKSGLKDSDFKKLYKDQEKVEKDGLKQKLLKAKVTPGRFDYCTSECAAGIHFFLDLQRALDYPV